MYLETMISAFFTQRIQQFSRGLEILVLAIGLSACASNPGGSAASNDQKKDLMTVSDESETHRRARIRLELAGGYFTNGQLATALDEAKQAIAIAPKLPDGYVLKALIYNGMKQDDLARESFGEALKLAPTNTDVLHNYGWYLCDRQQYQKGIQQLDWALAQPNYTGMTKTLLVKGVCQAKAGLTDEAQATLMRSYELDPSNPATAVNLSLVLYKKGEFEKAQFYIKRVNASRDLSNAESLWLAARIEHAMGNFKEERDLGKELRELLCGTAGGFRPPSSCVAALVGSPMRHVSSISMNSLRMSWS